MPDEPLRRSLTELRSELDRLLPEALEMPLRRVLGDKMPRLGDGDRYRIRAAGHFSGRLVGDLLAQAENQDLDGALVLMEPDVCRVLFFVRGQVVGASSNVLFERLGRLLAVSRRDPRPGLRLASGLPAFG